MHLSHTFFVFPVAGKFNLANEQKWHTTWPHILELYSVSSEDGNKVYHEKRTALNMK